MRLLADESIEAGVVTALREAGHTVFYIAELDPGIPDHQVLETATRRRSLLLTADKDFGELVFRQNLITEGVVLTRLAGLTEAQKAALVVTAVTHHESSLSGNFSVITPGALRTRSTGSSDPT